MAAMTSARTKKGTTFSVFDSASGRRFLIDTGASKSIIPPGPTEKKQPRDVGICLTAANGAEIATYGTRKMSVRLQEESYTWKFIVADVTTPILGADFLAHHELLVDVAHRRLISLVNFEVVRLRREGGGPLVAAVEISPFADLCVEFPSVFRPELT